MKRYKPRETLIIQTKKVIIDWICDNGLSSGDKLPVEREFALMLKVSRFTVASALNDLLEDGIVKKIPRRGVFLNTPLKRPYMIDVYFDSDWREAMLGFKREHHSYYIYRLFLDGILNSSSILNMSICFEFIDCKKQVLNYRHSLSSDGAIFANTYFSDEAQAELLRKKVPYAKISTWEEGRANNVSLKHTGLVEALEELYRLGHRKFGILARSTPNSFPEPPVSKTLLNWAKLKNIAIPSKWICPLKGTYMDEEAEPKIKGYLTQKELPTAIISESPIYTRPFFRLVELFEISIPRQISFLHSGEPFSVENIGLKLSLNDHRYYDIAAEGMMQLHGLLERRKNSFKETVTESKYVPGASFAQAII